jgi:hypothetical protein
VDDGRCGGLGAKSLELSPKSVDGAALLAYQKVEDLLDDFKESTKQGKISKPSLRKLWAEIEKLKKSLAEPSKQQANLLLNLVY